MSPYGRQIMEATGCAEADTDDIEETMRDESGGVLDHLTRRRFDSLARRVHKALPEIRAAWEEAS